MGGAEAGGRIVHYCHSLGGVESLAAKNLLSPQEAAIIDVYAFGSPRVVPEEGFHHVVNYVSSRDYIWWLDPFGYYRDNVVFLKSDGLPFWDHHWCSQTYLGVLSDLGSHLLEETRLIGMERNGVEPLTSTMPLLRSTN